MLLLGCELSVHALEGYDTCSVSHYYDTALITGSTMVIVLTGSANSVIHSVMVDVLERCVFLGCFLPSILFHSCLACLFFTGSFQLYHVYKLEFVCKSIQRYRICQPYLSIRMV